MTESGLMEKFMHILKDGHLDQSSYIEIFTSFETMRKVCNHISYNPWSSSIYYCGKKFIIAGRSDIPEGQIIIERKPIIYTIKQ